MQECAACGVRHPQILLQLSRFFPSQEWDDDRRGEGILLMSACQSSSLVTAKGQKPAGLRQRRQQRVPDPSRPRAAQSRGQQRASLMLFLWQLLNINSFLPDYRANDTPSQSRAAPPRGKTLQVLVIFRLACSQRLQREQAPWCGGETRCCWVRRAVLPGFQEPCGADLLARLWFLTI